LAASSDGAVILPIQQVLDPLIVQSCDLAIAALPCHQPPQASARSSVARPLTASSGWHGSRRSLGLRVAHV
jgi:hypothetical protein